MQAEPAYRSSRQPNHKFLAGEHGKYGFTIARLDLLNATAENVGGGDTPWFFGSDEDVFSAHRNLQIGGSLRNVRYPDFVS